MAYSTKVIDHYESPRNVGSFAKDEANVGTGIVGAPECGDVMKLQLKITDDGVIEDARFKTFGCGSAIASSSYVTELVKGKTVELPTIRIWSARRCSCASMPDVSIRPPSQGRPSVPISMVSDASKAYWTAAKRGFTTEVR